MGPSRTQQIKNLYKKVFGFPLSPNVKVIIESMDEDEYIEFYDMLIDKLNLKIDLYLEYEEEKDHMIFLNRLKGIMIEHNISLRTAMYWDSKGFPIEVNENKKDNYITAYLGRNRLSDDRIQYYKEIFLGIRNDFEMIKG
jgi:hypothetical protein